MFAAQVLGSRVLQVQVRVDDGAGAVVGDGERRVEEVLLERPLPVYREDGVVALVRAQLQDRDDPVVADPFQSGMSGSFFCVMHIDASRFGQFSSKTVLLVFLANSKLA